MDRKIVKTVDLEKERKEKILRDKDKRLRLAYDLLCMSLKNDEVSMSMTYNDEIKELNLVSDIQIIPETSVIHSNVLLSVVDTARALNLSAFVSTEIIKKPVIIMY